MKKTKEVEVCDFCQIIENDLRKCKVCERMFCYGCAPRGEWSFPDTSLCKECNDEIWPKFEQLLKDMKNQFKKKRI